MQKQITDLTESLLTEALVSPCCKTSLGSPHAVTSRRKGMCLAFLLILEPSSIQAGATGAKHPPLGPVLEPSRLEVSFEEGHSSPYPK